jgi:hypothetical protein
MMMMMGSALLGGSRCSGRRGSGEGGLAAELQAHTAFVGIGIRDGRGKEGVGDMPNVHDGPLTGWVSNRASVGLGLGVVQVCEAFGTWEGVGAQGEFNSHKHRRRGPTVGP